MSPSSPSSTPQSRRVFFACLLAFNILITPIAAIAGTYKKPFNVRQESGVSTQDSGAKSAAADVFAKPLDPVAGPAVPAAVPAPAPLPAAPPIGAVTASLSASLLAANGGIDTDNDGKADPSATVGVGGDTIAYTLSLGNTTGADATGLSIANPLDSHTTLVPGSLNSTPVAFDQALTTDEDVNSGSGVSITLKGQDPDGTVAPTFTFRTAAGAALPSSIATAHGTVGSFGSVTCTPDGVCSLPATYTPAANYNGADSFSFKVNDGTVNSNETGTVSITVNPVNDAPTFTVPGNPAAVNEDAGAQTVTNFVTSSIRPAQSGNSTEDTQTVSFVITNVTHSALFSAQPTLTVSNSGNAPFPLTANLTYTPAANANGTSVVTYHLHDNGGTANGGVDNSADQTFTITVNAVNDAPVAVNAAATVQANMKITGLSVPLTTAGGVTDADVTNSSNDSLSADRTFFTGTPPAFTLTSGSLAPGSVGGSTACAATGTISNINLSNGTFDYDPPPGFTGSCTLVYTITDNGNPGTATSAAAKITLTVNGPVIWFVDPTRATDGNGTLSNTSAAVGPFKLLSSANAKLATLATNQKVFVYTGTTAAGDTLDLAANNDWLVGQGTLGTGGTPFDTYFGITPPGGTIARPVLQTTASAANTARPTISGTVTMRDLTRVTGVNINVTGAVKGLQSAGFTNTSNVSLIKDVNVTSASGNAVDLSGNQTVTYEASDLANSTNVVSSTSGGGVWVVNTTIGANGFTFKSISSGAGSNNGIILNTTGSTGGGFLVYGDNSNTSQGGNNTGGTITGKSGSDGSTTQGTGIYLNSTRNVTLRRMLVNGTNQNFGIYGNNVTNFTLEFSKVTGVNGTSNALDEDSIHFDNLLTTAAITSCVIEGGFEDNLKVNNTSGTLDRLTVTGCAFGHNDTVGGNNSISFASANAGTVLKATVNSSTFTGVHADFINAAPVSSSSMEVIIGAPGAGNTFDNLTASQVNELGGGNRIVMSTGTATLAYKIQSNTLKGSLGSAIFARSTGLAAGGEATMNGRILNNTIGVAATANSGSSSADGIDVEADVGGDHIVLIDSNTITQYNNHGILMTFGDNTGGTGSARTMVLQMTVTNNTVSNPGNINTNFNGIHLNSGTTSEGAGTADDDQFTVCADIKTNHINGAGTGSTPPNNNDMRVRQRIATTVRLPGYGGAANDNTAVQNFLIAQNNTPGVPTVAASNTFGTPSPPAGGGFVGGATCTQPSIAMFDVPGSRKSSDAQVARLDKIFGNQISDSSLAFLSLDFAERPSVPVASLPEPILAQAELGAGREQVLANSTVLAPQGEVLTATTAAKPAAVASSLSQFADGLASLIEPTAHAEKARGQSLEFRETTEARFNHVTAGAEGLRSKGRGISKASVAAISSSDHLGANSKPTTESSASSFAPPFTPIGQFPVDGTGAAGGNAGFTLPAGKTITITFKATLNSPPALSGVPPATPKVTAQATLTGSFTGNPLLSDDPSVGGTTDPTSINVDLYDSTSTITGASPSNSTNTGQSVTFTAAIGTSGTPDGSATNRTGTVKFQDNGVDIGGCTAQTVSSNQATCTTSALTTGVHNNIKAIYSGDGSFDPSTSAAFTQTVTQSGTSTVVNSSVNPSLVGQSVTFTAEVTSSGVIPPTGTVQFHEGATNFGGPVTLTTGGSCPAGKGCASVSVSTLTAAGSPHTITADYTPDAAFTGSTGNVSQTVNKSNTTTALLSSLNPSLVTQNVTFTGTVTSQTSITGPPAGTLTFKADGNPITCSNGGTSVQTLSGGSATCQVATLAAGTLTITADYAGDGSANGSATFNASTGTLAPDQQVNKSNTTTSLSPTPASPATPATPVKFTATVASATAVTGPPAGTVQFFDGVTPITCTGAGESNTNTGETLVTGSASCTTSTLSTAVHSITATYSGDGSANGSATFNGSTSAPLSYTVGNPCSNSVVVTSNADSGAGTLREAIDTKVCDGGTITFDPSVVLINLNSELHFTTKNMTITGPGSGTLSIDGQGSTRIFDVDNGRTIVISGLAAKNGKVTGAAGGAGANGQAPAGGGGGGILNGGTLTLTDVIVNNGQAVGGAGGPGSGVAGGNGGDAFGGNIYNIGTLTLNNSTVSNGTASGGAGGSSDTLNGNGGNAQGGGIWNTGILNLNNSTISANTANNAAAGSGTGTAGTAGAGNGGGIYNDQTASPNTVAISGCTIDANTAGANGGGIFNTSTVGTLTISNSTISGNNANNDGGGIWSTDTTGTTTLTSVTVFGNNADKDNDSFGLGGGIDVVGGTLTLKNTIVGGNLKGPSTPNDINGNVDAASTFDLIGDTGSAGGLSNASPNIVGILNMATVLDTTLAANGGPTKTHALVVAGPANESGNSFGLTTDQRGFTRPVNLDSSAPLNGGDDADIGAYELQNTPPAPNAPDLDAASDTGASNTDNITADTSPTFTITGVVSGAVVELFRDTNPTGGSPSVVATGTASGTSIQLTDPSVAGGNYLYTARQTVSGAPSPSAQSSALAVTIDTSTPAAPDAPDLDAGSDSGTSQTDNLTNATAPVFTIGNVTNGFTVELLRDGNPVASGVAAGSSIQLTDNTNPPEGLRNYTSRQSNGVATTPSVTGLDVTFDRTAPTAPGTPDLQAGSDTFGAGTTGTNTDNVTNAASRAFDVTFTAEAGSTVTLLRGGNPVTLGTPSNSGASSPQTLTDADVLTDNTYLYTVQDTDAAGNSSVSAAALSVVFDSTVTASVPDLQAASDSFGAGTSGTNSDDLTKTTPRSFDVSATESGSLVELLRDGTPITSTAGTGSAVTLTDNAVLADNTYNYAIRETDKAGNVNSSSNLPVTIDTTPDTPGTPDLQSGSDAGTSNTDNRTDNATHSFDITGTLAGNFVELLRDGTPVSSTTAGGTSVTLTDSTSLADGLYHYTARQTDRAGNGPATSAGTLDVTIDTTAPLVSSDIRAMANPTSLASVDFTVTFSEDVTGVDVSDFSAFGSGGLTGASVTTVTPVNAQQYTVSVNTGTGDGNLRLDVLNDNSIKDVMNISLGAAFSTGEVYTVDRSNPSVSSITRAGSNPTNSTTVDFLVTFSETVTGVDNTDFTLTTTGVAGASVSGVTGSGATRTVTVNTGTGDGTIRLDVTDDDTIMDVAAKPLGGAGAGNGNFTTGQVYTIDKTQPTVTVEQAGSQADPVTGPASTTIINFTATFSEPVTGLTPAGVTVFGTAGATVVNVTGSGTTYNLAVQGMTQTGTVRASINAGAATDAAGNGNTASTSADNTVQFNKDDFTTFEVNTTADTDDGSCDPLGTGTGNQDCTLREAINAANADAGAETITFNSTVFAAPGPYTISLLSALPNITTDMTIQGPGANVLTVERNTGAATKFRIFTITSGTVTISGLTVTKGLTASGSDGVVGSAPGLDGGGISNYGTLTLSGMAISGNQTGRGGDSVDSTFSNGGYGGGVHNVGTLIINNSTISSNQTGRGGNSSGPNPGGEGGIGGGIDSGIGLLTINSSTISGNQTGIGGTGLNSGQAGRGGGIVEAAGLVLTSSTITANSSSFVGGGIDRFSGVITIRNSIIGGNSAPIGPDINGPVQSDGFNLVQNTSGATITPNGGAGPDITGVSPQLNPLADNGGPTQTHSFLCTSPVVDKGKSFGLTTDQRGGTRPFDFSDSVYPNAAGGDGTDIGAYEAQGAGGCLPTAVPPSPPTTTNEDTPVIITLTGTYSQNIALTFSITQSPTIGGLGAISAPNCNFNLSMTCTATVTYTPNPNANGSDLFKFKVSAGGLDSDPADVPVTVNATNDPPTLALAGNQQVFEDAGPQTVTPFAISSPGPADEAGQTVQFIVTNNTNPGLFSAAPAIDGAGTLTYTPAANANGSADITVVAKDNGGGTDTSGPQTFTITVVAVNDAPSFSLSADPTSLEDAGAQTVPNFATSILAGPANESGQAVQFIVNNNSNPGLFSSAPAISPTGTLTYTAAPNTNGSAAITVVLKDNGGTANGGVDTSAPQTFNINVTSVNDAPTLNPLSNMVMDEDAAVQTVNLSGISAGGGETQTLTVTATSSDPTLIPNPTVTYTSPNAVGSISFQPIADQNGSTFITVTVKDDGGTANGGVDTFSRQFQVTVNAVNDPPVNHVPGPQIAIENTPLVFSSVTGNQIFVTDVDNIPGPMTVTLTATNGTITLGTLAGVSFTVGDGTADPTMTFSANPGTVNAAMQNMSFIPANGFAGSASLVIVSNDQGRVGSGGPQTDTDTIPIVVQDGGALQLSASTYSVTENNGPAVITINRTGGSAGTATIQIATSNGTATAGSDYTAVSQTVTFGPGETTKTVNIPITNDLINEPDETVEITLSSPGGSGSLGSPATAELTIADDDPVGGYIKFSTTNYSVTEGGVATITVQRVGTTTQAVTVDFATTDNSDPAAPVPCAPTPGNTLASSRCDFASSFGRLSWAAGDGADKTFTVLTTQDTYVEGPETLTLTLSNLPANASFSGPSTATLTITDDVTEPPTNTIDDTDAYVEEQYRDFLNRPSDPSGKAFWVNNINHCNDPAQRPPGQTAAQCIEVSRIVTAGAFFLSIEFQATGGTAYLTNKVSFGSVPNFLRFERDAQEVGQNYVFGQPGADAILEANKVAYYNEYVARPEFINTYGAVSNQQYVDTLITNTGVSFTASERNQLVNGLNNNTETRATVLRKITEKPAFRTAEFNTMFVLMEYFGFLRRNPDQAGFNFWLNKLNAFNGDYFAAEMVKAFIESNEYRQRFGP